MFCLPYNMLIWFFFLDTGIFWNRLSDFEKKFSDAEWLYQMARKQQQNTYLIIIWQLQLEPWPWGYRPFFMLNSTEQEISTVHKMKNKDFPYFQTLRCCIYHAY